MKHSFRTLAEVFDYSTSVYSRRPAYMEFGEGTVLRFEDVREKCGILARLLSNFGIKVSDKVAVFSQNMPNWAVSFMAIVSSGRIAVPMLTELTENEITNILTHSEAKALFVSKRFFPRVPEALLERFKIIIATDDFSVLRTGEGSYTCDGTISSPLPDDIAAIIYTSGTTGDAKGVMLSHKNFCANIYESWRAHKVGRRDVFLSILPLAHTYELSIGMLYPFAVGAMVCYLPKPPTPSILIPALKKVRPTAMLSVPLVIEKIYRSSIAPTMEKSRFLRRMKKFSPALMYRLVGMRLMGTFGGRIRFFGIGGAKLDPEVEEFLHRAAFPYAIGYGVTEAAPLICNASPFKTCVGSTGIAAAGVQIRLENVNPATGEGEMVVKGDNVMRGYFKDYVRTRKVLSPDGWFHTGDIASMDKKRRYFIRGRLGNMIVGPSGENIYPEEIENVLNKIPYVDDALVTERDGRLVALVHLDEKAMGMDYGDEDRFLEELEKKKQDILDFVNRRVNRNSRIGEVQVEKEPFIKTATMKIRRFLYKKEDKIN